jgi:DNA polymerase (family 10)
VNPDAHDTAGLIHVRAGINVARKAGLTRDHLLNTRPLAEVKAYFEKRTAPVRARLAGWAG